MSVIITIVAVIITIVGDIIYLKWSLKEFDPSVRHNCEGAQKATEEGNRSLIGAVGINLGIAGGLLLWWGCDIGVLLLVAAALLTQLSL